MLATLAVNSLVKIQVAGWPGSLSTRVEDIGPDEVIVADPSGFHLSPPSGLQATLTWTGPFGLQELPTTLIDIVKCPVPQWRLRADGPALSDQRRSHVRAVSLTKASVVAGGTTTAARLVDVSEGGAHVVVTEPAPVGLGTRVTLYFEIDGGAVGVMCDIVRVDEIDGRTHAGCRFIGTSDRDADRIRRYVFRRQALERSRIRT